MSPDDEFRARLLESFRTELKEYLQTINEGLLALEQSKIPPEQQATLLDPVFRAAHSLKGAARTVGSKPISQLAHALEDILDQLRHQTLHPTPELFTACYQTLDLIQNLHAGAADTPVDIAPQLAILDPFRQNGAPPMTRSEKPAIAVKKTEATPPPPEKKVEKKIEPAPAPAEKPRAAAPRPENGDETIRVQVSKLDALLGQLSELLITKIRIEQRQTQLQELESRLNAWEKNWLTVQSSYSRLQHQNTVGDGQHQRDLAQLFAYLDDNQEQLRNAHTLAAQLSREYANDTLQMALVVEQLEEEIKKVRMLPLSTILSPFGRMVRDLAYEAGKEAILQIAGAETGLDKRILEQIKDPLLHMLRNAIDHGIERPDDRAAQGKPRHGTINLTAEQVGQEVVIKVSDDGRGLDLEAIRRTLARRQGEEVQELTKTDLELAIFNAGVSTSPTITDLSGRGVGLDVVRRNVEALHGRIELDWQPGQGTTFILTLPLALSNMRGLLVNAGGERFVIPLHQIERMLPLDWDQVTRLGGHDALDYQGRLIPLARLADILAIPEKRRPPEPPIPPIVIVAAGEQRTAFIVDALTSEQEIVNKGLGRQIERIGGLAGATVLGNGEIVLVLHIGDLIQMALHESRQALSRKVSEIDPAVMTQDRRWLLIVDDSITTRALEKNILEAAGYRVQLATNGQEAWDLLASISEMPELVISDVSMPRMDGIALTRKIKGDSRTSQLPVILVTSLDSPQDKARGIEAGADAYISKGTFDQSNLLDTVEQLI